MFLEYVPMPEMDIGNLWEIEASSLAVL